MKFQFRPVLTLCAAAGMSVLIALGVWQLQRRDWKEDLIARVEARIASAPISFDKAMARAAAGENMEYAPVEISGVYAHDIEAPVFGVHEGEAGAYVFTPLGAPDEKTGGRRFVYVNRGFVAQSLLNPDRRREGQVAGEVTVIGLFRSPEAPEGLARLLRPADQPEDLLWFARDPRRFAAHHQLDAPPFYVDSFGRENSVAWPRGGTTRLDFPNRHLEYALTWFGLAAALLAVWLAFSLTKG